MHSGFPRCAGSSERRDWRSIADVLAAACPKSSISLQHFDIPHLFPPTTQASTHTPAPAPPHTWASRCGLPRSHAFLLFSPHLGHPSIPAQPGWPGSHPRTVIQHILPPPTFTTLVSPFSFLTLARHEAAVFLGHPPAHAQCWLPAARHPRRPPRRIGECLRSGARARAPHVTPRASPDGHRSSPNFPGAQRYAECGLPLLKQCCRM